MKKLTNIIISVAASAMLLQGCDKLEAPYATVKVVESDTNKRTAVVEDYTGHYCVNCAGAAKTARTLEEGYHGQVFVISVHAGFYARPDATQGSLYAADFRCVTGDEWNATPVFAIDQNPKGMINRLPYNSKMSMLPGDWPGAVAAAVKLPKFAVMSMANAYDAGTRTLTTRVDTRFLNSQAGTYNLCVCILEDSIYGGQKNNDPKVDSVPEIKHFLFMDILRGSVNGTWGEALTSAIDTSAILSKTYSFVLKPEWKAKHCKVIAFVANAETYEILHARMKPVGATSE
jgi:hypothetical protein